MCTRALGIALIVTVGCAPKQVESPLEKAPPPQVAQARELAASGNTREARSAYESYMAAHPGTPEADLARLELGLLLADGGDCENASFHFAQAVESRDRAIALRATLHLAACELRLGDPERALETLRPVAHERFSDEEQALLWDTAIVAAEQTTNAVLALRVFDAASAHGGNRSEPERVWQTSLLLAQKVTIEEARTLSEELTDGSAPHTAVSMRVLERALDTQDAEEVASVSESLRASDWMAVPEVTMLVARADEFLHGNPYAVGAFLPLSGRGREVGRQLLQGMQLAQLDEGGPELIVEDSAGNPDQTEAAMERLVGERGVIAVLGPVSSRTTEVAARSARRAGVPLMAFSASEDVTDAGDEVFRLLYSPREEIAALVANARRRGLARFVILYPDHGYGRTMERLFDQEVAAAGGVACEGVGYPPGTKALIDHIRTVLETSCDVVLLADVADQVAVAAPTFAAEGAWSVAGSALPEHAERPVHFLLPSISWSPTLLQRSGRYLQGARITLPYYDAASELDIERFRTAYATRYGRLPQTFAAYGYDAYRLISTALRQGSQTRAAVREALMAGTSIEPVTSIGTLSEERIPAAPPPVYRIEGDALLRSN